MHRARCHRCGGGGVGHWNGLRIVDGIAGGDQDIFLTGGKENDVATWNIGPGSVASSKYDIVQAYLANNQSHLFFGMERRGNNGTTAFDFEFNQKAPGSAGCPADTKIPCRTTDDVLFTFEMQGSGQNGSAVPFIFTWNGSQFVAASATGILSSINNSTSTAGGPWGHVDSHGDWVLGELDRFSFAEATAPISLLPGVDACGGKAYVQVRTRSSSVSTSDLKDTTKIFEFQFNNISAQASLTPSCDNVLGFTAIPKDADGEEIVGATCTWVFKDQANNESTASGCIGEKTSMPAGTYTGTVTVTDPNNTECTTTATTAPVTVLDPLAVNLALGGAGATCPEITTDAVTYTAQPSGGNGNYSYTWNGVSCTGASCAVDPADSDFCQVEALSVTLSDDSGLCPDATSETENYSKVTTVTASDN